MPAGLGLVVVGSVEVLGAVPGVLLGGVSVLPGVVPGAGVVVLSGVVAGGGGGGGSGVVVVPVVPGASPLRSQALRARAASSATARTPALEGRGGWVLGKVPSMKTSHCKKAGCGRAVGGRRPRL